MNALRHPDPVILTPEHVPVKLFAAGLMSRFYAVLLDALIAWGVALTAAMILHSLLPFGFTAGLVTTLIFVITWGYHLYFEVRHNGRTPGKRAFGLRVVDDRGLPITFQQSFVRNIVRVLDFAPLFYGLGGLVSLVDRHHRRLGDLVAGTLVIHERPAADVARQIEEGRRFNSLRTPRVLRRIRHAIRLEDREFLLSLCLRVERMDPKARFDLLEAAGGHYRRVLEIDDPHLSGENLVRGLLSILYTPRA